MADFITNEVSLDRHGRRDGWFIQPEGNRPHLFLSNEELDALVAWKTGTGIWSPATPPRIEDMAPGTTFTAVKAHTIARWPFVVLDDHDVRNSETWLTYAPSYIDPATIRDVTPPEVTQ